MSTNRIIAKVEAKPDLSEKQFLQLCQSRDELVDQHNDVVKLLWEAEQNLIKMKELLDGSEKKKPIDEDKLKKEIVAHEELIASLKNCLSESNSGELVDQSIQLIDEVARKRDNTNSV